jgi:serine/threonine-protein kinase
MTTHTQFLRKASATTTGIDSLPGDITDLVLRRIVYLCLFTVGFSMVGTMTCLTRSLIDGQPLFGEFGRRITEFSIDGLMILVALTVAWVTHRRLLSSSYLIYFGLGFGVLVAVWMSIGECYFMVRDGYTPVAHFSFVAVWIVFFPAIVTLRSRATFVTLLLIAALPPLSRALTQSLGWIELPEEALVNITLTMAFSSVMGMAVAHVVYKLGKSVKAAREMGNYTLEENLGDGGMGEVWKASHRMLARPAAVKLIKPEVFIGMHPAEVDKLNHRFEHEVQSTAALFSPHTVDIYDYGVASDGAFFYVMELLDGIDMETLVEKFGPVEPSRVAYLMTQACHSLNEAHNRKMIHRDVKPANLFVCRYGDDLDFVKVLDFGLVKQDATDEKERVKLTAEGLLTGTPAYMAPEAVSGKSPVDHRSDLYSMGCVAYWLLTGRLLFTAETPMAMLMKHATDEPVPPSKRTELEIPADLDNVVMKCLEKDPGKRPQSAQELSGLLEKLDFSKSWDQERAQAWWKLHRKE